MTSSFFHLLNELFHTVDYTAIAIMTALESTFLPFPSEIPMTIVGIQSARDVMNPIIGLLVGLFGVWIGTSINYCIGYYVGDSFVEKYGKYFFIKKKDYHRAQDLFRQDADFYTFFGRLLPVVRHLISIPAGMVKMPYMRFISLSLVGSAVWLSILIALGYFIGDNLHLIRQYIWGFTGFFGILVIAWGYFHFRNFTTKSSKN